MILVSRALSLKLDEYRDVIAHLSRYGITGVVSTATHAGILAFGVELLGANATVTTTFAYSVVIPLNYLLHRNWSFRSTRGHVSAVPRYGITFAGGFVLNSGIMYFGNEVLGGHYVIVQAVAFAAVILWQFVLLSKWVFWRA